MVTKFDSCPLAGARSLNKRYKMEVDVDKDNGRMYVYLWLILLSAYKFMLDIIGIDFAMQICSEACSTLV